MFLFLQVPLSESKECAKASECSSHECCKEGSQLKRFLFGESKGTCRALRQLGEQCDPFGATSRDNPNLYVIECPCDTGLVCHSSGSTATAHNSFCIHGKNGV